MGNSIDWAKIIVEIVCPHCGLTSKKSLESGEYAFRCVRSEGGCGGLFLVDLKAELKLKCCRLQEVENDV